MFTSTHTFLLISSAPPSHFLPKNDIMLPCPALPDPFFDLSELGGIDDDGFSFVITGSSSENDSQAGSSRVTVNAIYKHNIMKHQKNAEKFL